MHHKRNQCLGLERLGSEVKCMYCSCRKPEFLVHIRKFTMPYNPAPKVRGPLLVSFGTSHMYIPQHKNTHALKKSLKKPGSIVY